MHPDLIETLREAQRFGFFGERDITDAVTHARAFVAAIGALPNGARLVDLGSGGGLPGLVLADAFPQVAVVLLDRRQKRTDFLTRAVRRLGWDHVEVVTIDARQVRDQIVRGEAEPFDAVTARGFGPPEFTLRLAAAISRVGAPVVVSEPPSGNRWPAALLDELGLHSERVGPVRRFVRSAPTGSDDGPESCA